ncbi:unnamed protein product [Lasius platythorax]|uniref:SAP domain-containing protein n=1 Tax=Lasius platythorax TaxID=488582 RepID=A0AAV2NPZ2_9HYME
MPTSSKKVQLEAARFETLRTRLQILTEEQLQEEANDLELNTEGPRERLLDRILDHYVRNTNLMEARVPEQSGDPPLIQIAATPEGSQASTQPVISGDMAQILLGIHQQIQAQSKLMEQLTRLMAQSPGTHQVGPPTENPPQGETLLSGRSGSPGYSQSRLGGGNTVKMISPQIPIFEGSEKDNIKKWLERVEYVGNLYEISENMLLLAATSCLAGNALDWYNRQATTVISS